MQAGRQVGRQADVHTYIISTLSTVVYLDTVPLPLLQFRLNRQICIIHLLNVLQLNIAEQQAEALLVLQVALDFFLIRT